MFCLRSPMADHRVQLVWEFETKRQHCEVRCRGCGRCVIYPPKLAKALFGHLMFVSRMEKCLRCTHCGAKEASVRGVYREYRG